MKLLGREPTFNHVFQTEGSWIYSCDEFLGKTGNLTEYGVNQEKGEAERKVKEKKIL